MVLRKKRRRLDVWPVRGISDFEVLVEKVRDVVFADVIVVVAGEQVGGRIRRE